MDFLMTEIIIRSTIEAIVEYCSSSPNNIARFDVTSGITDITNNLISYDDIVKNDYIVFVDHNNNRLHLKNSVFHNIDGPTTIENYGEMVAYTWYIDGYQYSFGDWCKQLNKSEEEINFLKLKWNIA